LRLDFLIAEAGFVRLTRVGKDGFAGVARTGFFADARSAAALALIAAALV
jgi:hypothetical protein